MKKKILLIFSLILSVFVISCAKKEETNWEKFINTQKGGKSIYGEPKEFLIEFEPKIDLKSKLPENEYAKTVKEGIEFGDKIRKDIFRGILPRERREALMNAYEKNAKKLVPLIPLDNSDIKPIAVYEIENDNINLKSGELSEADKQRAVDVYKNFTRLFPKEWIEHIKLLEINRDDKNKYAAYINLDEENFNTKLGINLTEGYLGLSRESENLVYIHEFAHSFSYNKNQLDTKKEFDVENFSNFKENSYLKAFNEAFWKNAPKNWRYNSVKEQEDADNFYRLNKDKFISPYSSVNVMEDFAESFVAFVLEDSTLTSNRLIDKKTNFFYQYPELVLLRIQILKNFR